MFTSFKADTGTLLWSTAVGATGMPIRSSPTIANGMVYIGSEDHNLYAFNAAGCGSNNTLCPPLWIGHTGGIIYYSSPAVANGVVYVGSDDGKLHAFDTSGKLLWTAATEGCVRSSPGVANGVVYVGSDDSNLYAFNAAGCGSSTSCSSIRTFPIGGLVFSSPVVVNGVVYVGSADINLYAFHLPGTTP